MFKIIKTVITKKGKCKKEIFKQEIEQDWVGIENKKKVRE